MNYKGHLRGEHLFPKHYCAVQPFTPTAGQECPSLCNANIHTGMHCSGKPPCFSWPSTTSPLFLMRLWRMSISWVTQMENAAHLSHTVLQYDDVVFFQAMSAPGKKCKKVFNGQVPNRWGQVKGGRGWKGGWERRWVGKTDQPQGYKSGAHLFTHSWII